MANKNKKDTIDIGELLSQKRNQLKLSIEEIAEQIKLSPLIIEQLESNQFKDIGNTVYTRGYLSAYVRALNLDEIEILNAHQALYPSQDIAIKPALGFSTDKKNYLEVQHSKTVSFLVALVAFFIVIGIYFINEETLSNLFNRSQSLVDNEPSEPLIIPSASTSSASHNHIISSVQKGNTPKEEVITNQKASQKTSTPNRAVVTSHTISEAEELLEDQYQASVISATNQQQPDLSKQLSIQLQSTEGIADEEADNTDNNSKNSTLSIQFNSKCWIQVIDGTGKTIISKLYKANDGVEILAQGELTVKTGRPSAISSFVYAGNRINLSNFKSGKNKYLIKP